MVLAISQFKVTPEQASFSQETSARQFDWLRSAPGFLNAELLASGDDPTRFHLVSRWTDLPACRAWQAGCSVRKAVRTTWPNVKLIPRSTKTILLESPTASNEPLTSTGTGNPGSLDRALAELREARSMLVHLQKLSTLGRMTASVAHDINNPVAFVLNNHHTLNRDFLDVMGLLEILGQSLGELAQSCPAVHQRLVQKAQEIDLDYLVGAVPKKLADNLDGLERIKRIVLDLRTFSRSDETGFKSCDLVEVIKATLRFLEPMLRERCVTVATEFAIVPPMTCAAGPLAQAISNILTNAIQASRSGQSVKVTALVDRGHCAIAVADEGVGIAPENLAKVFEPFWTTKPAGVGTGLGLSIARQIIDRHQGEIAITSEVGQGTTVRLRVPLHPPQVIPAASDKPEAGLKGGDAV